MGKKYTGISIQTPYAMMILRGEKTVEVRTYPIPKKHIMKWLVLIEAPGKRRRSSSRIIGIVRFGGAFLYSSEKEFYSDVGKHLVGRDSGFIWDGSKKYGWQIESVKSFEEEIPCDKKIRGVVFRRNIEIDMDKIKTKQ